MEPDKATDMNPMRLCVFSSLSSRGGKRGGRRDYSQHGLGVSSSLSSYGGEGRGEEVVNLTSELLPPDLMMPKAFQPLAGG